ncbi:MAG: trypsin-like peptidase domain-containing protein [Parcubacteria group bacterium]|nr:trypsin-like peptidase domain-containing protein [Parcubacteria group bacterium]
MEFKIFKIIISFFAVIIIAAFLIFSFDYLKSDFSRNFTSNENFNISTSSIKLQTSENLKTTTSYNSEPVKDKPIKEPQIISKEIIQKPIVAEPIKEVSSKSFEELINSSVIQLYCGNLNSEGTTFSNISRGTGIIINSSGNILTNRHIVYDENTKKIKNDCFILKSFFPNTESQKPKIYYIAEVSNYPLTEKFSDSFSEDKYYNDFAILKIVSKISRESKINFLLEFKIAAPEDYLSIENNGIFNFFPIDWNYQPKDGDFLITLGYGVDASHLANKITSTIGKIAGNVNINKSAEPQILLIESNATTGFSGGALINPKSKGLVGLVSWITAGDVAGKYTVAIFWDFLRNLMLQDFNLDLKLLQN